MLIKYEQLKKIVSDQPYPLLFATISGSHLYGFPSPDSDYDLRGSHILPIPEVVQLDPGRETIEISQKKDNFELDLVTHDIKKFFQMLLSKNGYVLEQLYSPLLVQTTSEHEELQNIALKCITRHHYHHYLGFARSQWRLFGKENPHRVKPLLYVFRVLLTGIWLMKTGKIETNLMTLNEEFQLTYIPDLISRKIAGLETSILKDADLPFYQSEYEKLLVELEKSFHTTFLPELPHAKNRLNDLLVRLRLK